MHRAFWVSLGWGSATATGACASVGLVVVGHSLATTALTCPADGLLLLAVLASATVLGRLTMCCLAATASLLARRCHRPRLAHAVRTLAVLACPRLLRSTVAAALAVGLSTSGLAAATAVAPGSDPGRASTTSSATAVSTPPPVAIQPLPSAVWPAVTTPADQPPTIKAPRPDAETWVVVQRGDCLWKLAAAHLGPGASDAAIVEEWHRWWVANQTVIGTNPDQLRDGSRLRVPALRIPYQRIPHQRGQGSPGRAGSPA